MFFKKINKITLTLILSLVFFLKEKTSAFAADQLTNPVIGSLGDNPEEAKSGELFIDYAVSMWRVTISIGALVVIGMYIMASFEWLTSGSDTSGTEKARNRFVNATIGLILLASSFAIVAFIGDLFFGSDFNLLEITFPIPN
ncbi:MAG: hypothetical protein U9O78_04920 [Patescibacteria group bacterium]|nr:hypothetical protein [Patescibacteria group bacterium]